MLFEKTGKPVARTPRAIISTPEKNELETFILELVKKWCSANAASCLADLVLTSTKLFGGNKIKWEDTPLKYLLTWKSSHSGYDASQDSGKWLWNVLLEKDTGIFFAREKRDSRAREYVWIDNGRIDVF